MAKKRVAKSARGVSRSRGTSQKNQPPRDKQKTSAEFVYFIAVIAVLLLHYFFISKWDMNHTGQVFVDFLIVFIIVGIFTTFANVRLKRNRNGFDFLFFLFGIATLVIDYLWISKIVVDSVIQVFLDFAIFTILCGIVMISFCSVKKR